ncbi:amidohydrolase family protein [Desulfosediminicola flagellatus]|uniref:amidohydrolase family protein n=1 Tax=Desulfosediminicola flagellatus TaxID=2569541 RepID=UPI0010AB5B61|nr:amidohydrolase family protein [Desulfosediminicola flagellatus]
MGIIDFRFRPNTKETLDGIGSSPMFSGLCDLIKFPSMAPQTMDEVVRDLKAYNVVKAVITGRDCETTYGAKSNNQSVLDFVASYPDMFIGFAGVDPHKGMNGLRELTAAVLEKGMKGAAIDPYLAQIYVNDAKYYPFYAKCCELNIPLIITTGPATLVPQAVMDHVAPRYIDFVARDFPELKIIVSHGGYPWISEMINVAQRNANVYVDLSEYERSPLSEAYIQAANTMISDKVIYASAHPFVDFKTALKTYEDLPFTAEARENIMYNNAARVLGLPIQQQSRAAAGDEESRLVEQVLRRLAQENISLA